MQSRENPWIWLNYFGKEYGYSQGPAAVEIDRVNCQWLVHRALENVFEYPIPNTLLSEEFYNQYEPYFRNIDAVRKTKNGDVFLFGPDMLDDYKKLHLAIQVGTSGVERIPVLLHATKVKNGVVAWELPLFEELYRYKKLYGKRRPNFEKEDIAFP